MQALRPVDRVARPRLPARHSQCARATKQRILSLVSDLERSAPFRPDTPGAADALLGEWALVFASDGTVVTRTAPAQLLAQLTALPGVGLMNIRQQLESPADGGASGGALGDA
ncbi:hypothetical protein MNEG_12969 [Monoraphidium neglectum]|uniref:Plastid lipid-associated protein/fibrillin conserved domain-containing protein n=1 Tax=Monoraphidium neglectum TaxID=145388 RepID=A0A0D2M0D4_9CHLO|nr:hypothetical protein MNEG_12969 [Monoraphidium neglectum]KIY94991.1 hypothetical protein MNEG_12969 [Monoraphidium neglectum]|eukprot:XP_013894011.1 hypothetical protein MNEG_12969 [Monoraphidium neglectum]